jgi:hypothetical protein
MVQENAATVDMEAVIGRRDTWSKEIVSLLPWSVLTSLRRQSA